MTGKLSIGIVAIASALLSTCGAGQAAPSPSAGLITLERQGSFESGGQHLRKSDGQSLACDHGHVEYQIPAAARSTPIFLWHSSSVSVWQRRWDGGEGFQSKILKRRYPVYLWDGPRVGRANWGCEDYSYSAVAGRDQQNFTAWRLGEKAGSFFLGVQFPTDDPAALDQANRARYQEFDTVANADLESDAAAIAIDRIGPAVVLTNSAAGFRALMTRLKSDNVAGIVAYENPGYILPDSAEAKREPGPFGPIYVPEEEFLKLTQIPIQLVWGDNINKAPNWTAAYALATQFAAEVNARGGQVEMLRLPDAGLHGNTHIPFADLNNDQVAALLFDWLNDHGFE